MAAPPGLSAQKALDLIDGPLAAELGIHRFDTRARSKAQLFAVGGALGKQFALVVGDYDVPSGAHRARQTRLLFERCQLPDMAGIEACAQPYLGSRIKNQQDSKLAAPKQVSCLVADEAALWAILRWYAGRPEQGAAGHALEQTRVAKAAADAGFDLTPEQQGGWTLFRSTAFPAWVGLAVQEPGVYRLGLSDAAVGQWLGLEFGLVSSSDSGVWAMLFDEVKGYARLHRILLRVAAISRVLHQDGLRVFVATTLTPPNGTEAIREAVQRVGQDIFRRTLIDYWGGRCAVTGLELIELLRASHIKPWADCESDAERLDVFNGLLLAPHLDALFDNGWVTFSDEGELVLSPKLQKHHLALLGLDRAGLRRCQLTDGHRHYLAWHRSRVFRAEACDGVAAS
jgi:hypothetical protein